MEDETVGEAIAEELPNTEDDMTGDELGFVTRIALISEIAELEGYSNLDEVEVGSETSSSLNNIISEYSYVPGINEIVASVFEAALGVESDDFGFGDEFDEFESETTETTETEIEDDENVDEAEELDATIHEMPIAEEVEEVEEVDETLEVPSMAADEFGESEERVAASNKKSD